MKSCHIAKRSLKTAYDIPSRGHGVGVEGGGKDDRGKDEEQPAALIGQGIIVLYMSRLLSSRIIDLPCE